MYVPTDYCIVGFPKCATTALARLFEAHPDCHLAKLNGRYESPYFRLGDLDPSSDYKRGKINGHKYAAYANSLEQMDRIYTSNPDALFVFCVRSSRSVLFSWWKMHRRVAHRNLPHHPINQDEERRHFHLNCTPEEYFARFASLWMRYGEKIERFRDRFPDGRFSVVSQERLARDPSGVMRNLLGTLGVEATSQYLESLPAGHEAKGDKIRKEISLSADVSRKLKQLDEELDAVLETLPQQQNLTTHAQPPQRLKPLSLLRGLIGRRSRSDAQGERISSES
ncbi:Sulfotransferase domain protein [Methyloligella halotolerans]|uniref:Sulfotransferase domain protein n=1 Tax=Methyloligella halotolerans TaxID=1177755 RepID=A0A1E2S2Q5_9HYPH|nr:sulfotransferase [Methyloligella halotolerans]ODA68724.1 Sulfotransferase domain protein [Methyloligella halotolerans]